MGKGDRKSRKGKIFMGTYGVTRPRKTAEVIVMPKKKKAELKKEEVATKAASKKTAAQKKKFLSNQKDKG